MHEKETQYQDDGAALSVMVRIGTVTYADNEKRLARVYFPSADMTSDLLPVVINRDFIPDYDGPQQTEFEAEDREPPAGVTAYVEHRHKLIIKPWMPKVNEQVLCLYEPIRDGRGFILGGIQPWQ